MPRKIIYLIRHGESRSQTGESNDHVNPDLSTRGIEQAKRLFPLLRNCHPQLILLSPLQRAWKTFQLSQARAAQQRFDNRLSESYPAAFYAAHVPFVTPSIAQADHSETYRLDAADRINSLWADISTSSYHSVMCFCHWNTCGHFLRAALGLGAENYISYARTDNAALSIIEIDDDGLSCLRLWNYTEHLHGLLSADETLDFLRQ